MLKLVPKVMTDLRIGPIVKRQAKRNKEIIYGAQAIKHQIFEPLSRPTLDWDLFSSNPKKSARQLERSLDKSAGGNWFYTKPAQHPGTHKVMDIGQDMKKGTDDDFGVADYTEMQRGVKTRTIRGVKFTRLSEVSKSKRAVLKDPESKYRHEKDRQDLEIIRQGQMARRRYGL